MADSVDKIAFPRLEWGSTSMGTPPFNDWDDPLHQCLWAAKSASDKWRRAKETRVWRTVVEYVDACLWLAVFASVHEWNEKQRKVRHINGTLPKTVSEWIAVTDEKIKDVYTFASEELRSHVPNAPVPSYREVHRRCRGALDLSYRRLVDSRELQHKRPAKIGPEDLGMLHTSKLTRVKHTLKTYNYVRDSLDESVPKPYFGAWREGTHYKDIAEPGRIPRKSASSTQSAPALSPKRTFTPLPEDDSVRMPPLKRHTSKPSLMPPTPPSRSPAPPARPRSAASPSVRTPVRSQSEIVCPPTPTPTPAPRKRFWSTKSKSRP